MSQDTITKKDFEKYGIIDVPSELELAKLPVDVYDQLKKTLGSTALTSGQLQLSEEEKKKKIDEIYQLLGRGQVAEFGSFSERQRKASPPLETEPEGAGPIPATTAVGRQQTVTGRRPQTLADVSMTIETQLPQALANAGFQGQDLQDQKDAFYSLYGAVRLQNLQNETGKNEVEIYKEALDQFVGALSGDVPILSEESVDPKMQGLTSVPYINAMSQQVTPGAIPDYTPAQLAYFQRINDTKINRYVDRNYPSKLRTAPRMFYVKKNGAETTISEPVLNYIVSSPTASPIFSQEVDDEIRDQYNKTKTFGISTGFPIVKINSRDYGVRGSEARAMAKVEAIERLGASEWYQDPARKKLVLENLDKFKEEGAFETRTPLGGTAESDFGYYTRLAFSPFSAFSAVTQKALEVPVNVAMGTVAEGLASVGVIPDLPEGESYIDPNMASQIRLKQRKKQAPLYAETMNVGDFEFAPDSIWGEMVDAVARNRGHVDYAIDLADGLNIDGVAKLGMTAGGLTTDFLSPDFAVGIGAIRGAKAGAKMLKAQRAIPQATTWQASKEAAKQFERTFTAEIMDDLNFVALTKDLVSKDTAKKLDTMVMGDVRLYMADDMARNLEARDALKYQSVTELPESLRNTVYAKAYAETGNTQRADELFTANIRQNEKASKMFDEYAEFNDIVTNAYMRGLPDAIQASKAKKLPLNYKRLDELIRVAQKSEGDELDNINNLLNTVYGRGIFFETNPKIGDMENIVAISRNTFAHKDARPGILATASKTKLGKSIEKVRQQPVTRQVKPVEYASYDLYGQGQVAKQGRTEMMYDLSSLDDVDLQNLEDSIYELGITPRKKEYLLDLVENRRLFESDLNLLVNKNRDDVAIGRRDIFTTDELNSLPKSVRDTLLDAQGTQARQKFRNGFLGPAIESITEGFSKVSAKFTAKKTLKETQKATPVNIDSFQKERMLKAVEQEINQLDQQLFMDLKEILKSPKVRAQYVTDPDVPMSKSEAMGALIVGQRQVGSGVVVQQKELHDTLMWMLNRVFYESKESLTARGAVDEITGVSTILDADIWRPEARVLISEQLDDLAQQAMNEPKRLWQLFQDYVNELDELLETDPFIEFIDPNTGEFTRVRLVSELQQYHKLRTVSNVELESMMNRMTMGAYFHAEGKRINHRYLTDVVDKEMAQLSVDNIFPGIDVDQAMFQNTVRKAVAIVWRKEGTYADQLTRVEQVVRDSHLEKKMRELDVEFEDIDVLDLKKSMTTDFMKDLKAEAKELNDEYKLIVKDINKRATQQYNDTRKSAKEEYDANVEELRRRQEITKEQNEKDIRKKAIERIKKVGTRSEEATRIRLERQEQLRQMSKDSTKEYRKKELEFRKKRDQKVIDKEQELKESVAKEKEDLRQSIDDQLEDKELRFKSNVNQRSDVDALDWFIRNHDKAKPEYAEIAKRLKKGTLSSEDVEDVARQSIDYANVVLRNQKLDVPSTATLSDLDIELNSVFGKNNEEFGRAILGTSYEKIKNIYVEQTILGAQESIKQVLQADPSLWTYVSKIMDITTPLFYFSVMGIRTRFYGMNFLTAPDLIYTLTGRFTNPISGFNVVRKGGIAGARGANDIAVRSPDGLTFTNRQVYDLIRQSGVKSEYNFIRGAMQDGSLLRFMRQYEKKGVVGYGKWFMDNLLSGVESINQMNTQTDMVWRASTFIDAIKEGSSVEEAVALARRSLFDYNDLSALERKYAGAVFVFYNFQRQSAVNFFQAMFDPKKLARYARIYKLRRDMNAIFADMNDGMRYPYEMYMPEYTQTRIVFGQQEGLANNRQLLLSPSIPSLDAIKFYSDLLSKGALPVVQERLKTLLRPELKLAFDVQTDFSKYKPQRVPERYVSILSEYNDDPQAIADAIALIPNFPGTVRPKFVGPNAVGNVNGYTYPLNEEQQKVFNAYNDGIGLIGATTAIQDYTRVLNPQGTTYEGLSDFQRFLALTGALTPARQKSITDQQILNLKRIRSQLRKVENQEKESRKSDMLKNIKPNQ